MDSISSNLAEYQGRLAARKRLANLFDRRSAQISNLRVVAFAVILIILWLAIRGTLNPWWIVAPLATFAGLVIWHDRTRRDLTRAQRAIHVYAWGIARIEDRWHSLGRKGERFRQSENVYAEDLDLFGDQSLFQLLSTARTRMGEDTLAGWLLAPAPVATVVERQKALREMSDQLDFREALAISGEDIPAEFDPAKLIAWAEGPELLGGKAIRLVAVFLAIAAMAGIVIALWKSFYLPVAAVILIEALIHSHYRKRINHVIESVEGAGESLMLFSALLKAIERHPFNSTFLQQLHNKLGDGDVSASHALKVFSARVDLLDSRENLILRVLNVPLLYELQTAFAMEAWRHRHGHAVRAWLDAIGETESLVSLATYSYEHPSDPFPELREDTKAQLVGESLGHPLIPAGKSVRNNVRLDETTRVLLVSGSNMSGKSTYLRTIGVNAVLAMAGAPVRARSLRLTPLQVGSSLHIVDSLQTGRSGFASELERLRQIMSLVNEGLPVLFLLDELLHGTNSHDRHIGGQALLRAFVTLGAIGVVTTHDLSITEIPADLTSLVRNAHFEDRIEDGHMVFDYVLREGAVTRSNALELMRSIGLDV
jgi:hypothetical protein